MKLITRDSDYAIRALCFMAQHHKKVVSVSDLVKSLHIPRPFLRKLLQVLNKKAILKSYKGIGGGFSLLKKPQKIGLVEVIEIFQGSIRLNECFLKKLECPNTKKCSLRKKINAIEKYVIHELRSISIESLLQ